MLKDRLQTLLCDKGRLSGLLIVHVYEYKGRLREAGLDCEA